MVLNDFERDMNLLVERSGDNKTQIAAKMGHTRSMINASARNAGITKRYVDYVEAMGYDIHVSYIKGETGLLTDFKKDIAELYEKTGYTKKEIADSLGIDTSQLRGYLKRANITQSLVKVCSELGYGIKLEYIPYMR